MASPSTSSRKKKRPRLSSSREASSTPVGARRSSAAAARSTPGSAASDDGSSCGGSAKSSRAKRRRSTAREFPLSFPRLDKGSVPPPTRRTTSSIVTSGRAETGEPKYLAQGGGGSDSNSGSGIVGKTSGSFRLTKRDVIAADVGASVSARQLTELFSPGPALTQPTQRSEGVSSTALAKPADARCHNSDPPGSKTDDVANVFEECGLFDDLAPPGMPREDWSPKRLVGGDLSPESAALERPKPDGKCPENLAGDTVSNHSVVVAAVKVAAATDASNCEKSSPMESSSDRLGAPKSGQAGALRVGGSHSGEHEASVGTRCANSETSVDELLSQGVVAESGRNAVVTMPTGERGFAHGVIGVTGWRRGGGDTVDPSSASETQVFALDTPPKSSAHDPARSALTSSDSDLPVEAIPASPSGRAAAAAAAGLEEASFSVPETQPSPRADRGRRSRRVSGRKEFSTIFSATIPETQPTVRTPTAATGRVARGSRRKVLGVVAATSEDVSQGDGSSVGRRSGLRSSVRRLSQGTSTVDCAGVTKAGESESVGAGADDPAAAALATRMEDVVLEGHSEAGQPSIPARRERAAPSGLPESSPFVPAPTAGDEDDCPTPATAAEAVATEASASPIAPSQRRAADIDADAAEKSRRWDHDDLPVTLLNQQTEASPADDNILSSSPADDANTPREEAGAFIEGRFQEGEADGLPPSREKSLRDAVSSTRQPSGPLREPHPEKECDRTQRGDSIGGNASPCGQELGPGADVPVDVEVRGGGGGNSWGEGGCEELVTPARPRRLAKNFEDGIDEIGAEDGAVEREETPPSAPGFDYSPVGCSQTDGCDDFHEDGITAAEMLNSKRSLCPDLPNPLPGPVPEATVPTARPDDAAPSSEALPSNEPPSKKALPSNELLSSNEAIPSDETPLSSEAPSLNKARRRSAPPRWVANPYATGVGALLTPRSTRVGRKPLPVSPFAATAEAAARRRVKAQTSFRDEDKKEGEGSGCAALSPSSVSGAPQAPPVPISTPQQPQLLNNHLDSGESARTKPPGCQAAFPAEAANRRTRSQDAIATQGLKDWSEGCEDQQLSGITPSADDGRERGSESGLPSALIDPKGGGFQTARGRPLEVSAAAMAKVQHLFNGDDSGGSSGCGAPSAGSSLSATVDARGKEKDRLSSGEERGKFASRGASDLLRRKRDGTGGDISASRSKLPIYRSSGGAGGGDGNGARGTGFQTGRGRVLSVSADALAKVEHLFHNNASLESLREKSGVLGDSRSPAATQNLFDGDGSGGSSGCSVPGAGSSATVDAKGKEKYRLPSGEERGRFSARGASKLLPRNWDETGGDILASRSKLPMNRSSGGIGGGDGNGARGTGFQTGRGRVLSVSANALAKVEHLFRDDAASEIPRENPRGRTPWTPAIPRDTAEKPGVLGHTRSPADVQHLFDGDSSGSSSGCSVPGAGSTATVDAKGKEKDRLPSGHERGRFAARGASKLLRRNWDETGGDILASRSKLPMNRSSGGIGGGDGNGARGTGFQTGRGRVLSVSADALSKVEHLFRDDAASESPRENPRGRTPSIPAVPRDTAEKPGVLENTRSPSVPRIRRSSGVGSGSARRRSFKPPARLSKADAVDGGAATTKAAAFAPSSACGGQRNGVFSVPARRSAGAAAFQTARGRELHVSDEAIARVSHMFAENVDWPHPPAIAAAAPVVPGLGVRSSPMEAPATGATGFQAASGGIETGVTFQSFAKVADSLASSPKDTGGDKMAEKAYDVGRSGSTEGCEDPSSGDSRDRLGFLAQRTTESGRRLLASDASESCAAITAEADASAVSVDINRETRPHTVKETRSARGAGVGNDAASSAGDPETSGEATATRTNATLVPASGGFCTARGRALTVSAEALARVSHLFDGGSDPGTGAAAETRSGGKETPSRKLGKLTKKGASSHSVSARQNEPVKARHGIDRDGDRDRDRRARGNSGLDTVVSASFPAAPLGDHVVVDRSPAESVAMGPSAMSTAGEGVSTGFSTGQGNSLRVSAEALKKTRHFFSEEDQRLAEAPPSRRESDFAIGSHTGDGCRSGDLPLGGVRSSLATLVSGEPSAPPQDGGSDRAQSACGIVNRNRDSSTVDSGGVTPSGFVTGRGAPVHVSADAMKRAKEFLAGGKSADDAVTNVAGGGSSVAFPTPLPSAVERVSSEGFPLGGLHDCGAAGGGGGGSTRSSIGGTSDKKARGDTASTAFSTGRGRPIEVSAEALARARSMFDDAGQHDLPKTKRQAPPIPIGGTAIGKKCAGRQGNSISSTANGTAVEVSAAALTRARKLFEDPGSTAAVATATATLTATGPPKGEGERGVGQERGSAGIGSRSSSSAAMFSTGTGRTVEVSARAMARAEEMFRSAESDAGVAVKGGYGGGGGAMFSTGRGRAVEVSPAALSRARKMFSSEEEKRIGEEQSESSISSTSDGGGGGAVAIPAVSLGAVTTQAAMVGIHDGAKGPFRSPVAGVRRPRGGKENGEGADKDGLRVRAASVDTTPMRLTGGGAVQEAVVLKSGGYISGTPRRHLGLFVSVNESLGGKPARAPFSPPLRGGKMLPPSGAATPSSRRKPLARRVSLAGASAVSPIGGGTPSSSKRRGLGSGSGGIQGVKRLRALSSAVKTSPRASPKILGGVLRGALPRPAAAVPSGGSAAKSPGAAIVMNTRGVSEHSFGSVGGATTEEAELTVSPQDCPATRKLFDSPARAKETVPARERISRRLPLSSLLNAPPLSLGGGVAESHDGSAAVDDAETSALAAAAPSAARAEEDSEVKASTGTIEAVAGFKFLPEAFTSAVGRDERRKSVAAVLQGVTPTTALRVRFVRDDGRPCCVDTPQRTTDAPKGSAARVENGDAIDGSTEAVAGTLVGGPCPRDRCRSAWDSGIALFREDLEREGKDGSLASQIWIENHLRWIVWKLAATERRFPDHFPGGYLTVERAARQLRYRYDVELERAKKPALKAVLQGDASAARPLILCVSRVYTPEELGARRGTAAAVIEVTDGWYSVEASLDEILAHFLWRGKIIPGAKLAVSNATLEPGVGSLGPEGTASSSTPSRGGGGNGGGNGRRGSGGESGVDPLELLRRRETGELPPGAGPRLRLVVNSTRRARWDSRLGFFPSRVSTRGLGLSALEVPLCTVVAGGGIVTATTVVILRRYPALYISEVVSGSKGGVPQGPEGGGIGGGRGGGRRCVLSEVEEEGERELHQARIQRILDTEASRIEEEVMAEMEDATPDSFRRLKEAENRSFFLETLSPEDKKEALDWRERHQQVMEGLRQKALEERLRGMDVADRRARQLITVRVACVCRHASVGPSAATPRGDSGGRDMNHRPSGRRHSLPPIMAMLKVWAPNEATVGLLTEGAELRLHSVSATKCRHHMSGCSLELSAGRQTKIELLSPPSTTTSPCSSVPAAASIGPARASNPPACDVRAEKTVGRDARFVPRRCTPLSLLFPSYGPWDGASGASSGDAVSSIGEEVGVGVPTYGGEADFVGCVFAVTRERSLSSMPGELLITADSTGLSTDSAGMLAPDGGGLESGKALKSALKAGGSIGGAEACGDATAELVTYRVYLTEPSGACACLEKKILPELSRHHRILRSLPGSCWAIVNGEPCDSFPPATACSSGIEPRLVSPGRGLRTGDADAFGISLHERHSRGFGVVRWSSGVAVGGSGGSPPPRTLASSPAGHLGQPVLALMRWSGGVEGTNAVRRERQRLAVFLARDKRVQAANARWKDGDGSGDGGRDQRPIATSHHATILGRENMRNAPSVIGYVSSIDPQSSLLENGSLGIQVDDGDRVRVLQFSRLVLVQLLRKSLGENGRRCCLSGQGVVAVTSEKVEPGDSGGGQSTFLPKLLGDVLVRAEALLERIGVPDLGAQSDKKDAELVTQAAKDAATDAQCHRDPQPVPPTGEIDLAHSARGRVVSLQDGAEVDVSALSPDQAIDELVGAVFQVAHQCRERSSGQCSDGSARVADPEPFPAAGPVLGEGAQITADDLENNALSASKLPTLNAFRIAGEGRSMAKVLSDVAAFCGRKQHVFAVAEAASPRVLLGLSSVVEHVGEVDAARSATELLEDLIAPCPPL